MFGNKKVSVAIASVAVAALLLTGTFAWQQMITKTNEFIGSKDDVRLHDDFDPNTGAKDVYVENKSEVPVYVRVKLNEFMDLGSSASRPGPGDWQAHLMDKSAEDCDQSNSALAKFHDNFTWYMGGSKYYMPADGSTLVAQDTREYTAGDAGARQTPDAQIVAIADYLLLAADKQEAFIGWIYDGDGFAYWSQPIAKDQATGLLLHKVEVDPSLIGTEYYYAIDVLVEAVDTQDIPMWTQGLPSVDKSGTKYAQASPDAIKVIGIITGIATS